ncbi:SusD/RagB family nutrient-binding outer membrane lipoprotein [Arenibacter sp. N53]|uniref:SusD/RagB family nutrient-binding outer membrane lipoprotein n=1 Tax=Arenibacter TaxID=178469 RepID=UPI000CD3E334|nr:MULTISPECIES: SusD/RagB family nutrient-binding outer membrane lipoprotein [Arenibacter]MCM4152727.1 SusD/RagB family nutrient-binding outer membrane lipoprotein [Arenibacter sp. N53]
MKNMLRNTMLLVLLALAINSCLKYDDLRENPNQPNSVPPSLIFTQLTPGVESSFRDTYERMQYHLWIATDNVFSPNFSSGFGGSFSYGDLRNIDKMIEEGENVGANEYAILGKFYKAYTYLEMTRRMGDVPLSEAVQGVDNPTPKYDSQKSVYIQSLNWLDEANQELGEFITNNPGAILEGDLYFNGNLKQWQRLINAYTIRILISLSKRESDADVNVKGRFANIISNSAQYPLLTGLGDNAQFTYSNADGFRQTYNPDQAVYRDAVVYAGTYIDMLKNYEDPRLMKVADPTKDALDANPDEVAVRADFNSYAGADISANGTENSSKKLDGDFSFPHFDKYWNYVGQPGIFMSYWEQELHIAEAAQRGWITEDAEAHYNNGVTASMEFYSVDAAEISTYLTSKQPYIAGAAGLTRILEQKYLAFAENSNQESFFTTRRTGVPTYIFSDENSITKYPVRWTYPTSEDSDNRDNYRAALRAQFGAEVDDRDQVIWLLKD